MNVSGVFLYLHCAPLLAGCGQLPYNNASAVAILQMQDEECQC